MSEDIDDLDPDELEEKEEQLKQEIEETERRFRELRIQEHRAEVEIRCLEYIEFRIACEEAVEDKPTMYPEADPLLN